MAITITRWVLSLHFWIYKSSCILSGLPAVVLLFLFIFPMWLAKNGHFEALYKLDQNHETDNVQISHEKVQGLISLHQKFDLALLWKIRTRILAKKHVACCFPECCVLMHFPAPHPHSLFSAFILLLSSRPMLSLCSVYSCLMSSLAASDFRGFLDACTLRAGRTARLCCTISEVSLRRGQRWRAVVNRDGVSQWRF